MIEPGTTIAWKHPDNGEIYYFAVKEAEYVSGGCWTITLNDNRKIDIWEHELCAENPWEPTEEQINPNNDPSEGPLR